MDAKPTFEGPVTLIFSRKVKPGRVDAYKAWVGGFQQASKDVKGFLGATTTGNDAQGNEYTSVVWFDTVEHLRAWEQSDLRREWTESLPPDTVEGEAKTRRLEGLESWFTAPGIQATSVPSPHKMALVLVVIVFLLVSALTPLLRALLGASPQVVRTAVMVMLQVGLLTYLIMPRVTKLLGGWLFRR